MRIVRVVIFGLLCVASWTTFAQEPAALSVQDAVALYAKGQFATAVRDLRTGGLRVRAFTDDLDAWIVAGDPASRVHRKTVAAAFALDATWANRVYTQPWQTNRDAAAHSTPRPTAERSALAASWFAPALVAEWVVERISSTQPIEPLDRTLWLATVGVAEDSHAWGQLESAILPRAKGDVARDARLRFALVLARTNSRLGSLRESDSWVAERADSLRIEHLPWSIADKIPLAEREFEAFLGDDDLAGEAELHVGYLELRHGEWAGALAHLEATRTRATDPDIRSAADYFEGWVFEQQHQIDSAVASYRRALAITPLGRSLALRVSALLYLQNNRAEAFAILDPALNTRTPALEPITLIDHADARFVPEWLTKIRKALQ